MMKLYSRHLASAIGDLKFRWHQGILNQSYRFCSSNKLLSCLYSMHDISSEKEANFELLKSILDSEAEKSCVAGRIP